MAPTPTMEPMTVDEEWRRMAREHPVMRMTRNDKEIVVNGKREARVEEGRPRHPGISPAGLLGYRGQYSLAATTSVASRTSWCDQFSLAHMGLGRTTNTVGPAQFHVWGYIFDTSKMMGVHCLHRREEISPCSMQLP
ncbi:hypothetical protein Pcinc_016141 [Petrolisthes cinctipes]|uniref:Uncharacterized protein n=1 Tax=Petrolisthes cinctipes TaxID=88211 RepID=A0AAE1FT10_PETCI|nr:hypothetical protein Pcinc_016141 [Petrolisthes cinctipes]